MSIVSELHTAILQAIKTEIPQLRTCAVSPRVSKALKALTESDLPALLLGVQTLKPADNPGTGGTCYTTRFQAHVVAGTVKEDEQEGQNLQGVELATLVGRIVQANAFEQPVSPGVLVEITDALPFLDAQESGHIVDLYPYQHWQIEWLHQIDFLPLGPEESCPPTPTDVCVGFSPEIGIPHESDYTHISKADEGKITQ